MERGDGGGGGGGLRRAILLLLFIISNSCRCAAASRATRAMLRVKLDREAASSSLLL
jgi:hypothetical protein